MWQKKNDQSPLEEGRRNTRIRRDSAMRGSMGMPPSGGDAEKTRPESDMADERGRGQDDMRGRGESE